jgi:HNH endonuclease
MKFKIVPSFPDYEINEDGILRRRVDGKTYKAGKIHKPKRNNLGWLQYGLRKGGQRKWLLVHRLVWEAFKGPIPDGCKVYHTKGKDKNNLEFLKCQ